MAGRGGAFQALRHGVGLGRHDAPRRPPSGGPWRWTASRAASRSWTRRSRAPCSTRPRGTLQVFAGGDGCRHRAGPAGARGDGRPGARRPRWPPGAGYAVKLCLDLQRFTHAAASAEVLVLGAKAGVEVAGRSCGPRARAEASATSTRVEGDEDGEPSRSTPSPGGWGWRSTSAATSACRWSWLRSSSSSTGGRAAVRGRGRRALDDPAGRGGGRGDARAGRPDGLTPDHAASRPPRLPTPAARTRRQTPRPWTSRSPRPRPSSATAPAPTSSTTSSRSRPSSSAGDAWTPDRHRRAKRLAIEAAPPRRQPARQRRRPGLVRDRAGARPRAAGPGDGRPVVVHPGRLQRARPLHRRAADPLPRPEPARRAQRLVRDHRGRARARTPGRSPRPRSTTPRPASTCSTARSGS